MKKLFIRILSLMLCALTVLGLTACGDTGSGGTGGSGGGHVHDYIDHVCSCGDVEKYTEGLRFKANTKGGVTVLGFEDGVTVPDTVYIPQKDDNGKKVTAIGQSAFEGSTFKNIVLPEGLEEIFSYAFKNSQLGAIEFPASLRKIYPNAFETNNLKSATFKVTTGWYIERHNPTNKPANGVKSSSYFDSKITNATRLTNCDTSNQGNPRPGACFWARFD